MPDRIETGTFLAAAAATGGEIRLSGTRADILESSESLRATMDYYAHGTRTHELLEKLSGTRPVTLACMHGSACKHDHVHFFK